MGLGPGKGLGLPERRRTSWTWWWVQRQALSQPPAPPKTQMTNGHVCWGDRDGCAGAIDHPALGATQLCRLVPPPTSPPSPAPVLGGSPSRPDNSGGRGGAACSGTTSAAADPTGTQRMPDTRLVCLCTSRRQPQTPAHTHIQPEAHSFAHVPLPVTAYMLPEGPAPTFCQPRHSNATNSLSGENWWQARNRSPHAQHLEQPPATRGLQLTHAIGPFGTWGAPHRVWC